MKKLIVFLLMIIISITSVNFCLANEKKDNNPVCIIKTSMGDIFVELFAKEAPNTVKNFIELAEGEKEYTNPVNNSKVKNHFYDNLIFHRVINNFMLQGGCPLGNGTSGPGYTFKDEINAKSLGLDKIKVVQPNGGAHKYLLVRSQQDFSRVIVMPLARKMGIKSQQEFQNQQQEIQQKISQLTLKECYENLGYEYNDELKSHFPKRGVIAMANSGPNTNGSQFFINLVDTPWLMGKHTVFGRVIKGMEVVDKIGEVAVDNRSIPKTEVKIITIRLNHKK
jgi:cyclophilin family peptidyl-prolyl cis-trans isomerase